jgi:hypothetical protein
MLPPGTISASEYLDISNTLQSLNKTAFVLLLIGAHKKTRGRRCFHSSWRKFSKRISGPFDIMPA